MSTTFCVLKPGSKKYVPIAYRSGSGFGKVNITWKNELAEILPEETKVYPIDNTAQGVYTMGDLKRLKNND